MRDQSQYFAEQLAHLSGVVLVFPFLLPSRVITRFLCCHAARRLTPATRGSRDTGSIIDSRDLRVSTTGSLDEGLVYGHDGSSSGSDGLSDDGEGGDVHGYL